MMVVASAVAVTTAAVAATPTATTEAESSVSSTSVTLNGTVNANGASTTVTFEYGLTTGYGTTVTADQSPVTGTTNTAVSKAVSSLTPNTTYHFRVAATNADGTTYGADRTFTTVPAAPTATTNAASSVSSSTATLNGVVNANSGNTAVTFEYGLTTSYGTTVTADQSPVTGATNTAVSKAVSSLTPNTTYHFRVAATNAGGTTYGADRTFTTTSIATEMDVQGNGISIFDGDTTPSATDNTEFGSTDIVTGTVDKTFTIRNMGSANLVLSGSPKVSISGTHASDFTIISFPSSPVAPGGSTTFSVRFEASATGVRLATLAIANNDSDENPYNFDIQGTGTTIPSWTLNITVNGTGGGVVDSNPTGINCGVDCSEDYDDGTVVTLTATPDPGILFSGWSGGGCSGTGTCQIAMNAGTTVTATFTDPLIDTDTDGITDAKEQGPDFNDLNYDGNGDGSADWQQTNVVSTPNYDGQYYITFAVPAPAAINNFQVLVQPLSADPPAGLAFPYGFFSFSISNVVPAGSVTATLYLEDGAAPFTYYKYGYSPSRPSDHWYAFLYDSETGAQINGHIITLYLADGKRGDTDLDDTNGVIVDPGGPAFVNAGGDDGG
jgi:hypothetical protein